MNIIKIQRLHTADDTLSLSFLQNSWITLHKLMELYKYMSEDANTPHAPELLEMGISKEDAVTCQISEILADIDSDYLDLVMDYSLFGEGSAATKLTSVITKVSHMVVETRTRMQTYDPYSLQDLHNQVIDIKYMIGDFVYSLGTILRIDDIVDATLCEKEFRVESVYQAFLTHINYTPIDMSNYLIGLRRKYRSVISILASDPNTWLRMTEGCSNDLIDSLIDLDNYIYPIDIKAFNANKLSIDDIYLGLLEARSNNENLISYMYPEYWAEFQEAVPAEYAYEVIELEPKLTLGLIEPVLKGNPVDKDFIHFLRTVDQRIEEAREAGLIDDTTSFFK